MNEPPSAPNTFVSSAAHRSALRKQRIVLIIAVVFLILFALPSINYEFSRLGHYSPLSVINYILMDTWQMIMSPGGIGISLILGGLYHYFRPPRNAGKEEDGYELLSFATKLEQQGKLQDALKAYADIARDYAHTPAGADAQKSLEILQARIH